MRESPDGDRDRGISPVVGAVLMVALVVITGAVVAATAFGVTDRLDGKSFQNDEQACPGFESVEFESGGSDFSDLLAELQDNDCALWLEGGEFTASGGAVQSWSDRGPRGLDATQPNASDRPALVTDSDLGAEVIEFDADHSALGSNPQPGDTDGQYLSVSRDGLQVDEDAGFAIVALVKPSAFNRGGVWTVGEPGQTGREFSMRTCSSYSFDGCQYSDPAGQWRGQHWGKADVDFSTGTGSVDEWMILAHIYDGSDVSVRVNGEELARNSVDLDLSENRDLALGRWPAVDSEPAYYFDGRIAEVLVFDRSLADVELDNVEQYLSETYDIPLDGPPG
jgi:flagellin-like protein